ncbi:MAG: AAA family ATPase [Clostridia bacterium]|nr:AAA family ATPase [Clostridia bacterium]
MGRIIFVTSFKGGVGKTTLAANLASALTVLGKKVLVVDADYGNRCMDLVLGLENDVLFDSADVIGGKTDFENAVVRHSENERLYFLPAPAFSSGKVSATGVEELFASIKDRFDFVLVDSSAEDSALYRAFARGAEDALIVTFHQSTAIRAAEKTAIMLNGLGFSNVRLIVNCFHKEQAEDGVLPDVLDMIQRAHVQLIGIIPFDMGAPTLQEAGMLPFSKRRGKLMPYEAASLNVAKRLCGVYVPLLKDVYKPKKLKKYL